MQILMVDDNEADANLINEFLVDFIEGNNNIKVIENGTSAIEYMKNNKDDIDLIILDLNLPGHSGHDILEYLKNDNNITPTIVYTSSEYEKDIIKAYSLNANCYIVKSFNIKDIR